MNDSDSPKEPPEFLTVQEVAALLRVAPRTVRDQINAGRYQAIKVGRDWRIRRRSIEQLWS